MAHYLKTIIGPQAIISELASNWAHAKHIFLNKEFGAMPLTEELIQDMNELANKGFNPAHKELEQLSTSVEHILMEISTLGKIGYIETEYFGGTGSQSAIAYLNGGILLGPFKTETIWNERQSQCINVPKGENAINQILYSLGVERRLDMDGFASIGLMNFRSNDDLLKAFKN